MNKKQITALSVYGAIVGVLVGSMVYFALNHHSTAVVILGASLAYILVKFSLIR